MEERDCPMMPTLKLEILRAGGKLPVRATEGSACYDIHACLTDGENLEGFNAFNLPQVIQVMNGGCKIYRDTRWMIPTGLKLEIPRGYYVKLYARSGLAIKNGMRLCNGVGVIDSDYRDEVFVLLNNSGATFDLQHGMRIAQISLEPVIQMKIDLANEVGVAGTEREGGLGSTGLE
jgi:dUTP pyrophosphatase